MMPQLRLEGKALTVTGNRIVIIGCHALSRAGEFERTWKALDKNIYTQPLKS